MQTPGRLLCPVCHVELASSQRQGLAIARCPNCRGVWLGRGELDKLVTQAGGFEAAPPSVPDYGLPASAIDHGYANADLRPDDSQRGGRIREQDDEGRRADPDTQRRRGAWLGALFESD